MPNTPRILSYLLNNEFQDGQPALSISPQYMRDLIVTVDGRSILSVMQFGAVGDGSTDDAAAINSAITACNASGGGTVLFPPAAGGFYSVNSVINLLPGVFLQGLSTPGYFDGWDGYLNTVLPGAPCRIKASSTFTPNNDGTNASSVVACSLLNNRGVGFGLRDIVIDGNARATYGISLNASGYYERRLYLDNVGVTRSAGGGAGLQISNCLMQLTDCNFYRNTWGISGFPVNDSFIVNTYIHSNTTGGINVGSGSDMTIIGGKIEENFGVGIDCSGTSNDSGIQLIGVRFQHNVGSALYAHGTWTGLPWIHATACWFSNNAYGSTSGAGSQLHADAKGRIFANGCFFENSPSEPDLSPYHIGVTASGVIRHNNSVYKQAASTANTYNDGTGTITIDGGSVTSWT